MKKSYIGILMLSCLLFVTVVTNAQLVVDFEDLSLETESYYDGSVDHSGVEYAEEMFPYVSGGVTFPLSASYWGSEVYSYGGMAYSNVTDQETASFTNFSAYANPAGGVLNSANYGVYYPGYGISDSLLFEENVNLGSVYIANHVWTYHYIMGSDGSGTGTFETDDFLSLTILAYNENNEEIGIEEVKLADYTEGNSDVLNNWTEVDLSSMQNVSHLKFQITSSDGMCPTYFCIDNLSYSELTSCDDAFAASVSVYPNPIVDYCIIENAKDCKYSISDATGRIIESGIVVSDKMKISTNDFISGMYFVCVESQNSSVVKKLIK